MKRIICVITLIYALSASMFLSGCSKQDEIKKVTVDEVRSELSGYEFSQHENLNFDCSVQNTEIGNVYKYKLHDHSADKAGDEEKKNAYALWRTLVSDESVQPKYSQDTQNCWFARAEKPYSYGAFYCGGSFGASSWDWGNDESADINETTVYKTMRACDDFSGEQYRVGGEDYKLTDAVKFCDDYIDKNLKQYFNEGEQLKLINVFVIENKMFDKYTYAFRYAHLIDGVAIDDCDSSDLEKQYLAEERKIQLHHALEKLNPDYSQVIYLSYFEGFSNAETAVIMKKSKRQVEKLLYNAKQSLKKILEKEGFEYEEL